MDLVNFIKERTCRSLLGALVYGITPHVVSSDVLQNNVYARAFTVLLHILNTGFSATEESLSAEDLLLQFSDR